MKLPVRSAQTLPKAITTASTTTAATDHSDGTATHSQDPDRRPDQVAQDPAPGLGRVDPGISLRPRRADPVA